MKRIFWSIKRKNILLKQAATMTVNQMAKAHMQPVAEIERMLQALSNKNPMIKDIRWEHGLKVTIYYPGYASNILRQSAILGARRGHSDGS